MMPARYEDASERRHGARRDERGSGEAIRGSCAVDVARCQHDTARFTCGQQERRAQCVARASVALLYAEIVYAI